MFSNLQKDGNNREKKGLTHIRIYIPITSQMLFSVMNTSLNVMIHTWRKKDHHIQKKTARARNSCISVSSAEDCAEHIDNLFLIRI